MVHRLIEKVSQGTTHIPVVWGDRKVNATGKNVRELLNFIFARGARPGLSTTVQIDDLLLKLCFDAFLDRQYYSYSFLDPANPGRVLYTAEVQEGGEGVLKSLESLPRRSVELLRASKAELATIDDDIRKLEANMRDEWPAEIEMISKKKQVEQLEAALEADEAGETVKKEDDWLTELEAEQQNEEREPEFPELNSESLGLERESQGSLSLTAGFRARF